MRWFVLIMCLLLVAVACRRAMVPVSPVSEASGGVAGIVAHTQSAQRHVDHAVPHADSTGKVHLAAATDEHQQVLSGAEELKALLVATQLQIGTLQRTVADWQERYARLEDRWYVTWGRRIEKALWIIGIGWLVLGTASVVLGMGNPLSIPWRIGKEITRLLPAMNAFSWLRDWLLSRKAS